LNGALKIVFVENYNVSKAEMIIPAADLSEQISTAGQEASGTGNMKLAMNGALTIGTDDGANIEMRQEITDKWWPFAFGCSADEIAQMQANGSYQAKEMLGNPKIARAVETLQNRFFAETEEEHFAFSDLHHKLIESHYGGPADRYFVLKDLEGYYETQKNVEKLYENPLLWAEFALHNIAAMGKFSSDYSIKNYADLIWGITPCPIDEDTLERIGKEYSTIVI
jgi:starch phosphorylase